jgi:hypothetical protein
MSPVRRLLHFFVTHLRPVVTETRYTVMRLHFEKAIHRRKNRGAATSSTVGTILANSRPQ